MHHILVQAIEYVRATWRYRWYMLAVAWLVALAGWSYVYRLPDQYEATTRVYVDTETLLAPLLSNLTVRPPVNQLVDMMTRTLLSRPNLEEVARRADLDLKAQAPEDMDRVITQLSNQIQVMSAGRNLFTLAYQSPNPEVARNVVQSLLNIFVESSLGSTRKDLSSSAKFIDQQVKIYQQKLQEMEGHIKDFKQAHVGMIPGVNEGDYYGQLQQAKAQLQQATLALKEAQGRRDSYKDRLQGTEPVLLEMPGSGPSSASNVEVSEWDGRIAAMERRLDEMRLRYTPQHPDVLATERVLADLKAQRKRELAQMKKSGNSLNAGMGGTDSYLQQLQFALAQSDSEVASLQARVDGYQKRYDELKGAVNEIPAVQAQYQAMTRDYNAIQANYKKLFQSQQRAELSGAVASKTTAVDFRVVDPPHVPSAPAGPNRLLLSSGVLLAAFSAGIGVAFLLGQLRPMIMSRQALERVTDRPFLGAISLNETPQMVRARRMGLTAYALTSVTLLVAFGSLATFYLVG